MNSTVIKRKIKHEWYLLIKVALEKKKLNIYLKPVLER